MIPVEATFIADLTAFPVTSFIQCPNVSTEQAVHWCSHVCPSVCWIKLASLREWLSCMGVALAAMTTYVQVDQWNQKLCQYQFAEGSIVTMALLNFGVSSESIGYLLSENLLSDWPEVVLNQNLWWRHLAPFRFSISSCWPFLVIKLTLISGCI